MVWSVSIGTEYRLDVVRNINAFLIRALAELAGLDLRKYFFQGQTDWSLVHRSISAEAFAALLFQLGVGDLDATFGEALEDTLQGNFDRGTGGRLGGDKTFQLSRQSVYHTF